MKYFLLVFLNTYKPLRKNKTLNCNSKLEKDYTVTPTYLKMQLSYPKVLRILPRTTEGVTLCAFGFLTVQINNL